jgi:hypothetical protein
VVQFGELSFGPSFRQVSITVVMSESIEVHVADHSHSYQYWGEHLVHQPVGKGGYT